MRLHWGVGLAFAVLGCGGLDGPLFGTGGRGGGDSSAIVGTGAGAEGSGGENVTVGPTSASSPASSSSSSSGAGGTGGAPIECSAPSDCPGLDNACQHRACTAGKCAHVYEPAGVLVDTAAPNDCKKHVCDGAGATVEAPDPTDPKPDDNPCSDDVCQANGTTGHTQKPVGSACVGAIGVPNNPGVCRANGDCVECFNHTHCGYVPNCPLVSFAGRCDAAPGKCMPPTCNDGIQNQCEPYKDCGGPCPDPWGICPLP